MFLPALDPDSMHTSETIARMFVTSVHYVGRGPLCCCPSTEHNGNARLQRPKENSQCRFQTAHAGYRISCSTTGTALINKAKRFVNHRANVVL